MIFCTSGRINYKNLQLIFQCLIIWENFQSSGINFILVILVEVHYDKNPSLRHHFSEFDI